MHPVHPVRPAGFDRENLNDQIPMTSELSVKLWGERTKFRIGHWGLVTGHFFTYVPNPPLDRSFFQSTTADIEAKRQQPPPLPCC
jgi:hypothetical protein